MNLIADQPIFSETDSRYDAHHQRYLILLYDYNIITLISESQISVEEWKKVNIACPPENIFSLEFDKQLEFSDKLLSDKLLYTFSNVQSQHDGRFFIINCLSKCISYSKNIQHETENSRSLYSTWLHNLLVPEYNIHVYVKCIHTWNCCSYFS